MKFNFAIKKYPHPLKGCFEVSKNMEILYEFNMTRLLLIPIKLNECFKSPFRG